MQVKIQPTKFTLGVDFVCMALFYSTIQVVILQLQGAVEKIWKKTLIEDQEEAEIRKESRREKESMTGKRNS